ncbi:MAG: DUF1499 domain-containing protein [Rhodospirillaceae bacterium]|nr:DUF1499 domain-containing protein [Rhodospirillaceae bacterium]
MWTWIAVAIVGIAILFVGGTQGGVFDKLLSHKNPTPVDFRALTLPESPNKYLIAPAGTTTAKADETAPSFAMPVADLKIKFLAMVAAQPNVEKLWESPDGLKFQYVQRTPIMRWPDIIDVQLLAQDGGSTLALYSRSVYGYSDMGVNKARVTAWVAGLK